MLFDQISPPGIEAVNLPLSLYNFPRRNKKKAFYPVQKNFKKNKKKNFLTAGKDQNKGLQAEFLAALMIPNEHRMISFSYVSFMGELIPSISSWRNFVMAYCCMVPNGNTILSRI